MRFDLLVSAEPTPEENPPAPAAVVVEPVVDEDVSMDVIAHECAEGLKEINEGVAEFKAVLNSFAELNEIKASIESHGIDDRLIEQVGDELDTIAASFKTKDVEATLAEIELSTEGIIAFIKEKAANLKARWKTGWLKMMRADTKIRAKLTKALDMAKKADGEQSIGGKKIVAYDYKWADVTIATIAKVIEKTVAIPAFKEGKDLIKEWEVVQIKLVDSYKLDDKNCILKYLFDRHEYVRGSEYDPEVMTVEEAGVANVAALIKYGDLVINSSFGNVKIENFWNKQYDLVLVELRKLPVGETATIQDLYMWMEDTLNTGYVECEFILRQYAVQTMIALQGVK